MRRCPDDEIRPPGQSPLPRTTFIAPVVLGGGKRLFEGFSESVELEHVGARQSQYATFIDYRVKRPGR